MVLKFKFLCLRPASNFLTFTLARYIPDFFCKTPYDHKIEHLNNAHNRHSKHSNDLENHKIVHFYNFRRASSSNAYYSNAGKNVTSPEPMTSPRLSHSSRPESVIDKLR